MGSKTANYKLNKPSYDDTVDIEQLNENAEIIDTALKGIVDEVSTKETPAGAQAKANTAESNAKSYTDAGLAGKVDISRVLTDVPANAKFTDTVYTHPSTHPASMIAESTTKRFVSDTEKSNWNDADSKKHTHINKSILDGMTQALIDAWNSAVDHISDAVKHITAAERTAWNAKQNALGFTPENIANKGQANGYASLDANNKVPVSQLPSLGIDQTQFDGHIASFIPHGGFNFDTSFIYNAAGEITQIDAKQNNVLRVRTTLSYSGEKLVSSNVKQYAANGTTVIAEYTDTISYSGEEISGVTRQVV